ncbi:hypothetical protein D3C83_143110 [compost metagenome]
MAFSVWALCRSNSGIVAAASYTRVSAWRTSRRVVTPCSLRSCVKRSDFSRDASVRRAISNSLSRERKIK